MTRKFKRFLKLNFKRLFLRHFILLSFVPQVNFLASATSMKNEGEKKEIHKITILKSLLDVPHHHKVYKIKRSLTWISKYFWYEKWKSKSKQLFWSFLNHFWVIPKMRLFVVISVLIFVNYHFPELLIVLTKTFSQGKMGENCEFRGRRRRC